MPYVHIQVTREGVTVEQKEELIRGATDLLVRVLNKNPATTFVVIEEVEADNWGVDGQSVTKLRRQERETAREKSQ
jgi:4-oxalocrotonate tautomerase